MKKEMKFEEAMLSLEDIVRRLEAGSLSLEDSIKAYEEAVGLISICNKKLSDAEQKVRILTENIDGTVSDLPFLNGSDEN